MHWRRLTVHTDKMSDFMMYVFCSATKLCCTWLLVQEWYLSVQTGSMVAMIEFVLSSLIDFESTVLQTLKVFFLWNSCWTRVPMIKTKMYGQRSFSYQLSSINLEQITHQHLSLILLPLSPNLRHIFSERLYCNSVLTLCMHDVCLYLLCVCVASVTGVSVSVLC